MGVFKKCGKIHTSVATQGNYIIIILIIIFIIIIIIFIIICIIIVEASWKGPHGPSWFTLNFKFYLLKI